MRKGTCKEYIFILTNLICSFLLGFLLIDKMNIGFEPYSFVFDADENFFVTFFSILANNTFFCVFLMFGIGVITMPLIWWQGFQLGAMFSVWISSDNSTSDYFMLLLPHGVIEFSSLIIFSVIGLQMFRLVKNCYHGEKVNFGKWLLLKKRSIIIGIILIFVAAIIECTLTPYIFNLMR